LGLDVIKRRERESGFFEQNTLVVDKTITDSNAVRSFILAQHLAFFNAGNMLHQIVQIEVKAEGLIFKLLGNFAN
jgi:hypothetical protein